LRESLNNNYGVQTTDNKLVTLTCNEFQNIRKIDYLEDLYYWKYYKYQSF